jgi:hypothetical protein
MFITPTEGEAHTGEESNGKVDEYCRAFGFCQFNPWDKRPQISLVILNWDESPTDV